jgi:hypothetical protein
MTLRTIIDRIRKNQREKGSAICLPDARSRIGFVFSSKERVDFSRRTLAALDCEKGFDLVWVDGSDNLEARELPRVYPFRNARLAEIHLDVRGGPDRAICYGLRRLLDLGYDYCGLIENDVVLAPGWFAKLLELFELASHDGLAVGAATVRSYESRVLEYRAGYTINWCVGAGMVLFSRSAAQLVLEYYSATRARKLYRFYAERFGVSLRAVPDLWHGHPDSTCSPDWVYAMELYKHGLSSVGSIPNMAEDLQFEVQKALLTRYVTVDKDSSGIPHPLVSDPGLQWLRCTEPFFSGVLKLLTIHPRLYRLARTLEKQRIRAARAATHWARSRVVGN